MAHSSGGKPLLLACGGCALLFVGLLVVSIGGGIALTQGPTNAVKAHVQLVKEGKLAEAYQVMSSGFRSSVTQAQFEAFVGREQIVYQGELTLSSRQVKNDEARIAGTATEGDKQVDVRFLLKREEGAWRVTTIEVGASTKPVVDAAKQHVKLVKEGKVAEAWQQTAAAFQEATSQQAFTDFVQRTGALYRSKEVKFPSCRLNEDKTLAEVTGKATGPDGKAYDVRLQLRNEEETWRVSLVKVEPAKPEAKTAEAKTAEAAKTAE